MNFLKKLGQVIINAAGIASGIGPIITPFLGSKAAPISTGLNDLTAIGQTIAQVEATFASISGLTGADKLRAATPLVASVLRTSELVSGHHIQDEAKFLKAAEGIASNMADLLSSLSADGVKAA